MTIKKNDARQAPLVAYVDINLADFSNGAVGWRPGGPMDCLGPYAKVRNCPIMVDGVEVGRRTCYATGYADTFFSVPACTRWKGWYVGGYFTNECEFHPYERFKERLK